jgi:hypothetical protein
MSQWTHDESSLCTLSKTTHCVSRGANDWPTNQNEEPVDQWATGLGPSYHLSPAAKSYEANQYQAEMSEKEKNKIVVSNVYWLMEIKLQIICSISFSGETIRSNYKNKNLFIFTALFFLKCVGGSIAQRCWFRILNHLSGPSIYQPMRAQLWVKLQLRSWCHNSLRYYDVIPDWWVMPTKKQAELSF